ncbi:MAG: dethiobiotin synthase [Alphaproteobacteria bacterium]|jgi:dethiobiotin synthase|nr:dethiobiotin synthase [Alphaproteobacteria bacterium]
MTTGYFVTGTDTDCGKTVAAAWLMLAVDGAYWKPVQSGLDGPIDRTTVQTLTGYDDARFLPSRFELTQPLSPHEAARRDGVRIRLEDFDLPHAERPLIVEGAGGLLVPLDESAFVVDLIARLGLPAVLVCRSTLGTINHTLLSLAALRARGVHPAGLIVNGPKTPHNRDALERYGGLPVIAEIDRLERLDAASLAAIAPEIEL